MDGVLGISTWGIKMEGADESTELWRHPKLHPCLSLGKIFLNLRFILDLSVSRFPGLYDV